MKNYTSKIFVILAALLFPPSLMELGLRIYGYDPNTSPHYRFHPQMGWTLEFDKDNTVGICSSGFRCPELNQVKQDKTLRLLNLGDSFSVGINVPYKSTFPGRLQDWLSQSGDSWEVINLAVGDWGTSQQTIALETIGLDLVPDLVLLQTFPFNDLCNNSIALANTCSTQDMYRPYLQKTTLGMQKVYPNPYRTQLRRWSILFGLLEERMFRMWFSEQDIRPEEYMTTQRYYLKNASKLGLSVDGALASLLPELHQPPKLGKSWKEMEEILHHLKRLLDMRNIPLIAIVIPYKWTLEPLWSQYSQGKPCDLDPTYGTTRVERTLRSLGIKVISIRQSIERSGMHPDDFFVSDGHFNEHGHEHVAGQIYEQLVEDRWIHPYQGQCTHNEMGLMDPQSTRRHGHVVRPLSLIKEPCSAMGSVPRTTSASRGQATSPSPSD